MSENIMPRSATRQSSRQLITAAAASSLFPLDRRGTPKGLLSPFSETWMEGARLPLCQWYLPVPVDKEGDAVSERPQDFPRHILPDAPPVSSD